MCVTTVHKLFALCHLPWTLPPKSYVVNFTLLIVSSFKALHGVASSVTAQAELRRKEGKGGGGGAGVVEQVVGRS